MRILTYITTEEDAGRAVRSVVPRRFRLGTHAFRRLKVEGGILCDGMPVRADTRLRAGQVLEIRLDNGETPGAALTPDDALPPSFIRYADEDILIVSKGAPLATLPCGHIHTGTLREQLAALLGQDAASFDYHPVNRLDKGTSGLLCVARHAHAQRLLTAQLHSDAFLREYLAVTDGIPDSVRDVVALSLTHNQIHRFVDRAASSGGGGCKCDQKGGSQYGDSEERRAVSGCVIPSPVGYADLVSYAAKTLPTH